MQYSFIVQPPFLSEPIMNFIHVFLGYGSNQVDGLSIVTFRYEMPHHIDSLLQ
jgi:hypothetical protein